MAASRNSQPSIISLLFVLIIFSNNTPSSFCHSYSPQNIQTFYPSPSPPPRPPPPHPIHHPPPPPAVHQKPTAATHPPPGSSTRAAVGKAIGITAAGTAALSGLLFFFLLRRSSRNRVRSSEEEKNATSAHGGENPQAPPADDFSRFNGNIKGLIVDENGVDVLYWKTVQENRTSFKKEYYNKEKATTAEGKKVAGGSGGRERKPAVQKVPLLRGKSSTSQSPVWADQKPETPSVWTKQQTTVAAMPGPPTTAAAAPPPDKPTEPPNTRSLSLGVVKVNPNAVDRSTVWDKGSSSRHVPDRFDGDLMEALFGTVAKNRNLPHRNDQIFILDARKSYDIAVLLNSIASTQKEITDSVTDGRILNTEKIEKLTNIVLTDEEASRITTFTGDLTRLADAESFLYHLLKSVPSAFTRFRIMLFRSNYHSSVSSVKHSLETLELACKELRSRGLFVKLLEAVLKAGNRLSTGTSKNAQAFNITALRKLSDVKSSDGRTTLLEFVVQEVVRAEGKRTIGSQNSEEDSNREREYMTLGLPVFRGLNTEFSNVKKAGDLDYMSISELSLKAVETRALVSRCGDGNVFVREMNEFLDTVEPELGVVREEENRVMELVKETSDYYEAGFVREKEVSNTLQLFVIVKDFLGMVEHVCMDIERNVQSRKAVSSVTGSSSSPEPSRVFRFPKLPANFMSENSMDSDEG